MKLQPSPPFLMPSSPSSCSPPFPLLSFPFIPPSLPPPLFIFRSPLLSSSLLFLFSPFPLLPLPFSLPPSVFPMDCLPIDSYCICTSLFIIPPPSHPLLLVPSIFGGEV